MTNISLSEDIRPLSEFRAHTTKFIRHIHDTKRPIVITQHGKSSAVLIDVGAYENLLQTLHLLRDIRTAEQDIEAGRIETHAKAEKKILAAIEK